MNRSTQIQANPSAGDLDEGASIFVVERIARALFEAMPHRHPSGRTPDWSFQPASIRDVFIQHADAGKFDRLGIPADLAANLRKLHAFAQPPADERSVPPSAAVLISAIDVMTGDFAGHEVDVTLSDDGTVTVSSGDATMTLCAVRGGLRSIRREGRVERP